MGSAPSLMLGMVDPIEQLAPLAGSATSGSMSMPAWAAFLPFAEQLGEPIPRWDFRVPGVTTISADLHKFGYTAKGASLVMSRERDVFDNQLFRFGGPAAPRRLVRHAVHDRDPTRMRIAAAWAV